LSRAGLGFFDEETVMKRIKASLVAAAVLFGVIQTGDALAHGSGKGKARIGVFIGVPLAAPWYYPRPYHYPPPYYYSRPYYYPPAYYYPRPYYYYPPVVAVPSSPPVYIEQGTEQAAPAPSNYWYYCSDPEGYYPYVKQCSPGWQRVAPQPPPG
jgi:hypothetical protein